MLEEMESMIDSRSSLRAIKQRFQNIPPNLKTKIDERDNDGIISFIQTESSNVNENFKCTVLQLTIQNDPETLEAILSWGAAHGLTPATGKDDWAERHNPILVSCQHDFQTCMEYLYQHGYRMKDIDNTAKEQDQVKKFLIFKAASNIHYLSLEFTENKALQNKENAPELTIDEVLSLKKVDPVRRVYKLMENADENMDDFQGSSELKCNYLVIKKELEVYLGDILTQCEDMQEVKTILDYNPDDDDDDELDDSDTNWQVALYKGHKHLVSHPNFQQYIWRKMTGEGSMNTQIPFESLADKVPNGSPISKFGMKRALLNLKNVPLTILTFLFYTIVVLADLFRKGDIMFVSPRALMKRESTNRNKDIEKPTVNTEGCFNRFFGYFRKRMHIPLFRMIPYFFIQVTYLILLCVSIWNPVEPVTASFTDENYFYAIIMLVTFIIAANFLVDDIIHIFRPQHLQHRSCWSLLSLISHLLLVGGALIAVMSFQFEHISIENITSLADISGNNAINVGMVMLSFGAGLEFFGILRWLVLLETTGPIVLCVLNVIGDALRMVSIYVVLFVAHGIAFWSLYKPFRPDSRNPNENVTQNYTLAETANALKTQRGLVSTLFWRIIASSGPEMVNIKNNNDPEHAFSIEFSHLMGLVLWGLYQIIIYILMLNLLIAVLNTSYSKLWQNVEMEWKFNKSRFQAQFLDPLAIFPVPFRWNYYLAEAVYGCKKVKDEKKQDTLKYYSLVRQLILNKKEEDFEKSIYEQNKDLKKDIINELKKLKNIK